MYPDNTVHQVWFIRDILIIRDIVFLTGELLAGTLEEGLDAYALLLGDAGGETESLDAAAHADAETRFILEIQMLFYKVNVDYLISLYAV